MGHQIEILVGYCTKANSSGLNSSSVGIWSGIPFRYLSNTTKYHPNRFYKLWIFLKSTLVLISTIFKARRTKKLWIVYGTTWYDFLFVLPLFQWTDQKIAVIYTELPSLLSRSLSSRLLERILIKYSDSVLVVSQPLYSYLTKAGADVVKIIPIVAEENRFSKIKYRNRFTIGYLGTFGSKDNVNFIIQGFLEAKKVIPDLTLRLMGFIPDDAELRNIEKLVSVTSGISYSGALESGEIPKELAQCDTLIMNRTDTPYARAGFPIKLAEYLATGIPTLVTDFEEYHDYISEDVVYFYQPDNLDDFVSKILHRYAHEEEAVAKAAYAKKTVPSIFGEEKAARELDQIFTELMSQK